MPYLVIDTKRKIVLGGLLPTQAAADALALTDSGWTAHSGDVTGANFHANTEPGWLLTTAGATCRQIAHHGAPRVEDSDEQSSPLCGSLRADLHQEASRHPLEKTVKVHDYFARLHQSNFQIVHENPNNLSVADRTAYAIALPAGPQDGSGVRLTIFELFNAINASTHALGTDQGVTYVNPSDAVHLTIDGSLAPLSARKIEGWDLTHRRW